MEVEVMDVGEATDFYHYGQHFPHRQIEPDST